MRMLRLILLAVLMCTACAGGHHRLAPQEQLRAEIEAMREAVAANVPDAQHAAQLKKAIDGLEMELLSFRTTAAGFRSNVQALNSRPDATRSEFDTLVEAFDRQRSEMRKQVLKLHSEMIAATTAEEWKRLAKYERAVLSVPPEG